jgi:hypothetical protein
MINQLIMLSAIHKAEVSLPLLASKSQSNIYIDIQGYVRSTDFSTKIQLVLPRIESRVLVEKFTVSNRTLNESGSVEEGFKSEYENEISLASLIRKTAPLYRVLDVTSPFFS